MAFLTDFADLAVLGPFALCVGGALMLSLWWRGAAAWAVAVGGTLAAMLALKLLCLGCVAGEARPFSPSGHTAAGCCVYGGVLALILRRRRDLPAAWLAGGLPAAIAIGASRLALGVHSPAEVLAGGTVGMAGVLALVRGAGRPPGLAPIGRGVAVALPLLVLLHGTRAPAESALRRFAGWMPQRLCLVWRARPL